MERISEDRLQQLIEAHGAALTLYARTWCHVPEDAVQEALVDLLRQSPLPDEPIAWLFTTVRRRAMNLARGERCRREHHRRAAELRDHWFVEDSDAVLASAELARMLERLPLLEREVVVARVWGQLPFEQVAELVEISCSAAHRRYRRALELLAEMMDPPQNSDNTLPKSIPQSK